jgi:hypothetical protein
VSVLDDLETRKDTIQVAVEGAFHHVGQIAGIISGAGRDVTRELGDWATEVFEMRDAARRARADRDPHHPEGTAGPEGPETEELL